MSTAGTKMALSDEETRVYRRTLETADRQLQEIDRHIEQELAEVKERLGALRDRRKAALHMYNAACAMLGIPNEHQAGEESDPADSF